MFARAFNTTGFLIRRSPVKLSVRCRQKLNKEKPPPKVAADVVKYLETSAEYTDIKNKLPKHLLRKYKTPESMYLINKKTAKEIVSTIKDSLKSTVPVVEVNPGLGILSQELLRAHNNPHYLYEVSHHFEQSLQNLQKQYPDRVRYKIEDFFGMWKLAFQDKMDNGNRINELLGDLATDDHRRPFLIVGSMPSLSFVKHLIYNIVFHNTHNKLGWPNLFITMPAYHYEFLTDTEIQLSKHKSIPALFQLLFDCKFLKTVPTVHYLPWITPPTSKKVAMMDEYRLYLVNITQKQSLPCPPEYLPLLWYFFKPHVFSKRTRVIPMLEQWIPGCGVWLITGQDPPDTRAETSPGADDEPLPHMTIFTEFGDLNLKQKITVFKKFISWPEFEQCQFKSTMENNLPKFIAAVDGDEKDRIVTIEDDDHSDSDSDTTEFHK